MYQIYTELDVMLDTRVTILKSLYPDIIDEIVTNELYFKRLNDDFVKVDKRIDTALFKEAWKNRDNSALHEAAKTKAMSKYRDMIVEHRTMTALEDIALKTRITINTHPYVLTEAEQKSLAEEIHLFTGFDEVEIIHLPYRELGHSYLKDFTFVELYDMNKWLGLHLISLGENPLYGIVFSCPIMLLKIPDRLSDLGGIVKDMQNELRGGLMYAPQPMSAYCFEIPTSVKG